MFGYVRPYIPDLRVREHEMYRALYCGLCRSMGRHTGCASRFTLSYDFVLLCAVRIALEECEIKAAARHCMSHPIKKRPMIEDNSAISYSAACAAVLTNAKLEDDIADSKGAKRLGEKMLRPTARGMERKALKTCELPKDEIYRYLGKLSALESAKCPSIDEPADCFGDLLGTIFAHGLTDSKARIAYAIGKGVGKYIYVIDAADDREKDKKSGNYNPLNLFPVSNEALSTSVRLSLNDAVGAAELIDFSNCIEIGEIIRNTLYEGLPKAADRIIFKENCKKDKKK